MIALVDYGAGNLASVRKALAEIGASVWTPTVAGELGRAHGVVVPGVGHFDATRRLTNEWRTAIRAVVADGTPLLGICVGLQWLFEGSDEAPGVQGLGTFNGNCFLLPSAGTSPLKIPHVGWNSLTIPRPTRLMTGIDPGTQVYFTHSYAAPITDDTAAICEYGVPFSAAMERDNVTAVQFHPEKSGPAGLHILGNWMRGLSRRNSERSGARAGLSKRIIACLDVRDGKVVKGVNFEGLRDAGDPATLARRYNVDGIDEIVILDVTATLEARQARAQTIRAVAKEIFLPLTVGGGIRSDADADAAIEAGADKVSLNTAALENPELITSLGSRYGSQAVIVAIDAKRDAGRYTVFSRSGSSGTGRDAVEWAREATSRGAGEILLTSIDRDGTKAGFDCELTAAVSAAVNIPVIASGGAGTFEHFADVFTSGRADAALAASIFHFNEKSVSQLKAFLQMRQIPVRI